MKLKDWQNEQKIKSLNMNANKWKRAGAITLRKQLNEMRSEARKMLSEAEVDSSDEVVNLVVTDTAEQTKLNVEAFLMQ